VRRWDEIANTDADAIDFPEATQDATK